MEFMQPLQVHAIPGPSLPLPSLGSGCLYSELLDRTPAHAHSVSLVLACMLQQVEHQLKQEQQVRWIARSFIHIHSFVQSIN